jgi:hypothetical protein
MNTSNSLKDNHEFDKIKNIKNDIDKLLIYIIDISNELKNHYTDLANHNKSNIFLFGIDSLFSQNKLINFELKTNNNHLDLITNKMYCEYFKLYKLMLHYVQNEITDSEIINNLKIRNTFPVYKDLEINKKYDFKFINDIHQEISNIFAILNNYLLEKKQKLISHKDTNNLGLNIDNFVNTFNFNVNNLENQIKLFYNYLNFFYKLHYKHLNRFLIKIEVFYIQIRNDINININNVNNENMKNDILNKTNENNLKSPIRKSINVSNFDLSSLGNQSDDEYQKINNLINKFNINDHNDNLNNEKNNDIIDNLNNEQNNKIKSNLNDSDSESEYTIQNNSNKNNNINKKILKKNNNNK